MAWIGNRMILCKNSLPSDSLKTLYNSLIFPHISYGLEVWGAATSNKNFKRIVATQKKAIRTVTKSKWLSHTEPRMKTLGLLKITDQHHLQCLSLVFDMTKGHCNDILGLREKRNVDAMTYNLRSTSEQPDNLRLSLKSNPLSKSSFSEVAPRLWNETSLSIQNSSSRKELKGKVRRMLLGSYGEKVSCVNPLCTDTRFHELE